MHKTILLITLLFVCFTSAHSLTDIEKKYYDNMEKQNQKLTEQVESQQKEINDLKLNQNRLENLVINEPARLDKRIDDAKEIFSIKLDFATYIIGALGLFITVSGLIFGFLGININKTNKAIVFKQKEYDEKLKKLHSKADAINQQLENHKEKLPAADKDIKSYTPEDLDNLEEYVQLLRREKAEKDYTAGEWFYIGLHYQNCNKFEDAIKAYDEAIRINPKAHAVWGNKGIALISNNKFKEAIEAFNEALNIKPNLPELLNNKGVAFERLNEFDKAIKLYEKAIGIKYDYVYAWFNKGDALQNLKRHHDAIKAYEEAIKIKPDYHEAWNGKAWNLMLDGKYQEALEAVNKAIELKNNEYSQDTKAAILMKMGRFEEALEYSNKAIELVPEDTKDKDEIEKTHRQILEAIAERDKAKTNEEEKDA
ncbi:MAG: tetratricopeptide repeat protein [Deferribacterales bacterium]